MCPWTSSRAMPRPWDTTRQSLSKTVTHAVCNTPPTSPSRASNVRPARRGINYRSSRCAPALFPYLPPPHLSALCSGIQIVSQRIHHGGSSLVGLPRIFIFTSKSQVRTNIDFGDTCSAQLPCVVIPRELLFSADVAHCNPQFATSKSSPRGSHPLSISCTLPRRVQMDGNLLAGLKFRGDLGSIDSSKEVAPGGAQPKRASVAKVIMTSLERDSAPGETPRGDAMDKRRPR